MALVCIYLFCKYLNTKSQNTLIPVLILSILCGACDKLFFICFTIPVTLVVIVLFFFKIDRKTLIRFLVFLAIGAIGAIALWLFFKNNPYFSLKKPYGAITETFIKDSWLNFSKQFYRYLTTLSYIGILTWFSIISYLAVIIYVFKKTYKLMKEKSRADALFAFQLFVLFFTPIVLFAPVLAGSYDDATSIRYNYFPYLLLPFNSVILASSWLSKNKLYNIILNTTLSILIVGYLLIHFPVREFGKELNRALHLYPEKARIIDDYFSDGQTLKYGITNEYWTAKQATMFSKKGVRLHFAFPGGDPWLHVANKNWFIDHDKGKHAHCEFTYLLWSKDSEIPEFFKAENPDVQPVDLGDWYLYIVAPYRFVMKNRLYPVLIDTQTNLKE